MRVAVTRPLVALGHRPAASSRPHAAPARTLRAAPQPAPRRTVLRRPQLVRADSAASSRGIGAAPPPATSESLAQLPKAVGDAVLYSLVGCVVLLPVSLVRHPLAWLAFGSAVGWYGWKTRALSLDGAVAGSLVGAVTLSSGYPFAVALLAFYVSCSKLTSFGAARKVAVEGEYKKGGERNATQVFANAGLPTALAFAHSDLVARGAPVQATAAVAAAAVAYYACCCGDTWSSEIGVLSSQQPVLITTGKPVSAGTNGGVTLLGVGASAAGGAFIGLVVAVAAAVSGWGVGAGGLSSRTVVLVALLAGLLGSLLDSVLGATVQYSGIDDATGKMYNKPSAVLPGGRKLRQVAGHDWVSNSAVNFATATLSAVMALVWIA